MDLQIIKMCNGKLFSFILNQIYGVGIKKPQSLWGRYFEHPKQMF